MSIFFDSIAPDLTTPGHKTATILPDGRVALLWSEEITPGGDNDRQMLQLDAAGANPPAPVVLDAGGLLYSGATITALSDGNLAVSWRAYNRNGGVETDRVLVQVLDAQGTAQGQPLAFDNDLYRQDVMLTPEGTGFAMIWHDQSYDAATDTNGPVVVRRQGFDAQGATDGPATEITRLPATVREPEMVALSDGNLAVLWHAEGQGNTVSLRVFAADGTPAGAEVSLPFPEGGARSTAADLVALPGGGVAVIWRSGGFDTGTIRAQAFDATGLATTPAQVVATDSQTVIDAIALPGGRIAVAVDDRTYDFVQGGGGTTFNVTLQELGADMTPLGAPERVLSGVDHPFDISLAADANGRIVISWEEDNGDRAGTARLTQVDASAFTRLGDGADSATMDGTEAGLGAGGGDDTIIGSAQDDAILGGAGNDDISGEAGADRIDGEGGDDILRGGEGDDLLLGKAGQDRLIGDAGADTLVGGDGRDLLNGGAGADMIYGWDMDGTRNGAFSDLSDTILGMEGADTIDAGAGNDLIWGGTEDDFIFAGAGADRAAGQDGNDTINGGSGSDLLFGGAGNDTLDGGQGFDRLNGGDGADHFVHVSRFPGGSDWVQDYDAAQGDRLVTTRDGVMADWYQVNIASTANAGADDVDEAFVIFRPTGQIVWALVDGAGLTEINLQIGDQVFDLLA
ncbi:calcium-binding protein [Jannaschia sp. M317]|uniref:calcium-binding protein n=1 Tax=Jannaschia sp. M317 TaxID=2867011 RepID=UPI00220F6C08|nr:calcium-binding protein [Jannaschia sp. M317]UWQ19653.1 hypothetical protein K3551_18360 [Jannaschia sp. M317]